MNLITNANDILFRCSSLGHIMTDGNKITEKQLEYLNTLKEKETRTNKQQNDMNELLYKQANPRLSSGVITHLVDTYVASRYGRREEIKNKYLDKGNACEEDSITLLSRVKRVVFKKNAAKLSNQWIKGAPDIYTGESITNADETFDTKTSWSAHTFFRAKMGVLDSAYEWQGIGYMFLTGAKRHTVAFCLVNGTAQAIADEKRRATYEYGIIDINDKSNESFIERCKQIEINHIFDLAQFRKEYPYFEFDNNLSDWNFDIPMQERVHTFSFERGDVAFMKITSRVNECRQWMNQHLFKL